MSIHVRATLSFHFRSNFKAVLELLWPLNLLGMTKV